MSRATKRLGIAVLSLVLAVSLATGTFLNVSAKQYLPTEDAAYAPQFGTLDEAKRAGNKLNERIAKEGMILPQNEATDGRAALPLGASERRVSVFGSRSDCEIRGGSGSGSGVAYEGVTFLQAMEDAGFQLNPKLKELYAATGENEPGIGSYTPEIVSSYPAYSDLAIIVFSVAGNFSKELKLSQFSAFFKSINKWIIGVSVSVFGLFFTVQGLTSATYDGIVRRAAKYAIGTGVQIVGGFLSGGFDLAVAGSILIKNSLGNLSVVLMIAVLFEPLVLLIAANLFLRLTAAVTQPLGESRISDFLGETADNLNYCTAGLLFVAFLYFISIVLIICSSEVFF